MNEVVVVGAGAAGMLAAWRAAEMGAQVLLLEKTNRVGTKILISGGGKCNITHDGPIEDVLRAFRPNEARFIRPACYRFQNHEIVQMLTDRGLEVYTRPDGRIFPTHGTAKDVVRILRSYLEDAGVVIRTESPVERIRTESNRVQSVVSLGQEVPCRRLIVSVGGSSYPGSGTTGDGYRWLKEIGHTIVPVRAALAPIYLRTSGERAEWSGIAFRDCVLRARQGGKEVAKWRDDLLLTHHGISGPTALGISRVVTERMLEGPVSLEVDILPDASFEDLTSQLVAFATESPRRLIAGWVEEHLPSRLVVPTLQQAEIPHDVIGAKFEKRARNRLVTLLKAWPLGDVRHVPLEKGEVVAGGVALDEVDPKTLRSRKVDGLWLCGEVLDIAGPVGGYNLQAAFATGFVAGEDAAIGD